MRKQKVPPCVLSRASLRVVMTLKTQRSVSGVCVLVADDIYEN